MKRFADKQRREEEYEVGELVFVRLQPYRQQSVQLRRNQKLGLRYFGPFPIVARVGQVAYQLKLPDSARIHDVFHISQLRRCRGDPSNQYISLPLLTNDIGPIIAPLDVLGVRQVWVGDTWETQVLIDWDGVVSPTWEPVEVIKE